jgi:hypothetical protein
MRSILVALIIFSAAAVSEDRLPATFESNYLLLQKKIESLKATGAKVNEDTRKQIDALMVQMNHEHTELKRELERRNSMVKATVASAQDTKDDYYKRVKAAYQALSEGAQRAWAKLKKGED